MHIVGILACHGMTYPTCAIEFKSIISRICSDYTIIIVDNALSHSYSKQCDNRTRVIGSEDTLHEFTCLNTGLRYCEENSIIGDSFLLATSALMNEPNDHLKKFTCDHYSTFMKSTDEVCGLVDSFGTTFDNLNTDTWIRTNFIVLKHRVIKMLNNSMPYINCNIVSENLTQISTKWLQSHNNYKDCLNEKILLTRLCCLKYEKLFTALLLSLDVTIMNMRHINTKVICPL